MSKQYASDVEAVQDLVATYKRLRNEIGKVIIGQEEVVQDVLISIFSKLLKAGTISTPPPNPDREVIIPVKNQTMEYL